MNKKIRMSNWKKVIIEYMKNNSKEYILVMLIFIIGILLGVMVINNTSTENSNNIITYISNFIDRFKTTENIDTYGLLAESIKSNVILAIIVWFAGTTIIGMPVVLGIILFRGFSLGFTISGTIFTLGVQQGIVFCLLIIFLQNIIFIPALLTMGVSSIKLYKSIVTDRRKENIKIEIIRHTIISLIMLGILVISSIIESEIAVRLLKIGIKYIK